MIERGTRPGSKLYAYLDESGEFKEGSRPSLVAGFTTSAEPRRLDEIVDRALDDCAGAAGLDPGRVRHLTELRSTRVPGLQAFLRSFFDRLRAELPDMRFFALSSGGLPRVSASDTYYLDLAAEAFAALAVLGHAAEEWVFCPAVRVKEAYHGRRAVGVDPCLDEEAYGPAIEQRVRDRVAAFGRGSTAFDVRSESPRLRAALVAADYVANCRWQLWRPEVQAESRALWEERLVPALAFDLPLGRLSLYHEVRQAASVGQWDAAFIQLARGILPGEADPRQAAPFEWAAVVDAMRADESRGITLADLVDSLEDILDRRDGQSDPRAWFALLDALVSELGGEEDAAKARFTVAGAEAAWAAREGYPGLFDAARGRALALFRAKDADAEELLGRIELERLAAWSACASLELEPAREWAAAAVRAQRERLAAVALAPFAEESERDGWLSLALSTRAKVELTALRLSRDVEASSLDAIRADCREAIAQAEEPSEERAARVELVRLGLHAGDAGILAEIATLALLDNYEEGQGFRAFLDGFDPERTGLAARLLAFGLTDGEEAERLASLRSEALRGGLMPARGPRGLEGAVCLRELGILALTADRRREASKLFEAAEAAATGLSGEASPPRAVFRLKLTLARAAAGEELTRPRAALDETVAALPLLAPFAQECRGILDADESERPKRALVAYRGFAERLPW